MGSAFSPWTAVFFCAMAIGGSEPSEGASEWWDWAYMGPLEALAFDLQGIILGLHGRFGWCGASVTGSEAPL